MTKKIVSATAVLIGVGSLFAGCNFDQPNAGCVTQDSTSWQAVYELQGQVAPATGSTRTAAECQALVGTKNWLPAGETVGIFKFTDPNNRSDSKLVLRPNGLASRSLRDGQDPHVQNAVGKLDAAPDANDFCSASAFSAANVDDKGNATPTTGSPIAPTNITYQFDNVRVYTAPNAPGTTADGSLTYTRDGCTGSYKMQAIWPVVGCDPAADPATAPRDACGEGSGANPDFSLKCHPTLGVCVPAKELPTWR